MINMKKRKYFAMLFAVVAAIVLLQGVSSALDVYLRAESFVKTMPDGTQITMWGFAQDSAFEALDGTVSVPGPTISVPVGESLSIHLDNNLPEAISIVIPGQEMPTDGVNPVTVERNPDGRVRSFVHETAAGNGAAVDYVWTAIRPGTYLYESGTHPAVQVQMGLYGALKKDNAAGEAYPDNPSTPATDPVTYVNEVVLLFSEIDPLFHNAIAGAPVDDPLTPIDETIPTYGTVNGPTSTINYLPKYFLINGEPYSSAPVPVPLGGTGQASLVRFLNAGLKTHTPVIHGYYNSVVAEDGNLYPFPKQEYALSLHPGQTLDAVFTPASVGLVPVYDRSLGLSNAGTSPGGMLAFLQVGASSTLYTLTVATNGGVGTGTVQTVGIPGGISCGLDCSEVYLDGTVVTLTAIPDAGFSFGGWSGDCTGTGPCVVTMSGLRNVVAAFSDVGINVMVPNGGETWGVNTTRTIFWSYTGNPGANVKIELLRNGVLNRTIAASVPLGTGGLGSYNWLIPPADTGRGGIPLDTTYQMRVTSTTNAAYTDTSDANFAIATIGTGTNCTYTLAPVSSPLVPIAGGPGSFTITTQAGCAWTASTALPWITITAPTGPVVDSATVDYTVGDNTGGVLRSGVITAAGKTHTVNQDGLVPPTAISVVAPNGGETWTLGSTRTIQWSYTGTPGPNVRIELLQNGVLFQTIAASVPIGAGGNGSYVWTVPSRGMATGSTFTIRVTSTTDGAITDTSNATFTISL